MHQYDPARWASGDTPIYASLIRERGDVPAEAKRVAAQLLAETGRAIDFRSVRTL
ncbi:hypothetical protein OG730_41500 (plasmid) [Streptomyces sp. NBC_01298]|uniref:hypothetical protein n=1 Tax=Streptomyces sp. NBC_01298 TaxID=2903817 RepID=UPI002E13EAC8|nr:hypothetical protein OG730_42525 [Streptomyces sp. NBC_01298]WSK25945.1 hypothetical protein OG730_41500 [Streptomyces sp. NBC_01298]